MRFYGTLIGPQGGQVYKSGTDTLEADVRHDGAAVRIEIRGSIVDGVPHVRVTACGVDSQVVFYSGPIADAATRKTDEREPMVGPFRMTDQACGCGRSLREFEVALGGCTSCQGYEVGPALLQEQRDAEAAPNPDAEKCCPDCPGWAVFNADEDSLGVIQGCDDCGRLTDDQAAELARTAGYTVDVFGKVLAVPAAVGAMPRGPRGLTDGERRLMNHISRWGSDGYGAILRKSGRGWVWGDAFDIKGPPTVFRTKRLAVASLEAFLDVLLDAHAGRI